MPIGLTTSQSPPYEDRQRIGGDCAADNPAEPRCHQWVTDARRISLQP